MANNALLQRIAAGAQPRIADAMFRGARQGNALMEFQREQQKQNALAEMAQAYAQGGPEAAMRVAGQLGQFPQAVALGTQGYQRGRDTAADQFRTEGRDYSRQRDLVGDQFRNKQFAAAQAQRDEDQAFRQQQFGATQQYRQDDLGLRRDKFLAAQQPDINPAENFEAENKLRKDFQSVTKDFRDVRNAHGRIKSTVTNPTPAGDLSLIFNYMKMLDPGSVVRESEFALAAKAGSYGERIKAMVNNVTTGELLTKSIRADFVNRADKLFKQRKNQYGKTEGQFKGLAKQYGFDPEKVVLDFNEGPSTEGNDLKSKYGLE